ncbi:unnamed protein product, partial [Vitis vinifera]
MGESSFWVPPHSHLFLLACKSASALLLVLGCVKYIWLYTVNSEPLVIHSKFPPTLGLRSETTSFRHQNVTRIPSTMDWRKKRTVTHIKNQLQCGGCWAFSAVAAMEGIAKLQTSKSISLSEQELVDCDIFGSNIGCEGGCMDDAFKFIIQNRGLNSEASADGKKHWLVKNSWGTDWGENGYTRMERGVKATTGLCGFTMQASYPTA